MNTASITIKTHPEIKAQAQKAAEDLGYSLNALLNKFLEQFAKTKKISTGIDWIKTHKNELLLDAATEKEIGKSLQDRKEGRYTVLKTKNDLKEYFKKLNEE